MALAEAQALAIRKLLSKSANDETVTPGPPLPKSHPPPGLIAKLHLECATLFSSARSLVKTARGPKPKSKFKPSPGKSKSTDDDGNMEEVAPELKRYLAGEAALHSALGSKWLGVDCGEDEGLDRVGQAVGYLQWAKKELEELKDGTKAGISLPGVSNENEKKAKDRRKDTVAKELETVTIFLKHYRNMNDTVRTSTSSLYSDHVQNRAWLKNAVIRSHSNLFSLRPSYRPSSRQGKWQFQRGCMSFLLRPSVLGLRATSRMDHQGSQSPPRHSRGMMTATQRRRLQTIQGQAPIFDPVDSLLWINILVILQGV